MIDDSNFVKINLDEYNRLHECKYKIDSLLNFVFKKMLTNEECFLQRVQESNCEDVYYFSPSINAKDILDLLNESEPASVTVTHNQAIQLMKQKKADTADGSDSTL